MDHQKTISDDEGSRKSSITMVTVKSISSSGSTTSSRSIDTLIKYSSLVILVIQMTSQVLLMRYASTRDQPPFLKSVAVFWNEVVKLVAALIIFVFTAKSFSSAFRELKYCFWENIIDTMKVSVTAFVYTIQNFLLYIGIENLDAGTYMVVYQLKILTTAIFTVTMLRRRLSIMQWFSLVILVAGVVIVEFSLAHKKSTTLVQYVNSTTDIQNSTISVELTNITALVMPENRSQDQGNPIIGFITVFIAAFLSGFGGVYFEKILKSSHVSLWVRNIQLALLSIPIAMGVIAINDRQPVLEKGFMQGFDEVVWGVIFIQALGGIVVAIVIKYADNILKSFSTSISILLSTIASMCFFYVYPRLLFIFGAALVVIAMFVYGIFPYRPVENKEKDAESGSNSSNSVREVERI